MVIYIIYNYKAMIKFVNLMHLMTLNTSNHKNVF